MVLIFTGVKNEIADLDFSKTAAAKKDYPGTDPDKGGTPGNNL